MIRHSPLSARKKGYGKPFKGLLSGGWGSTASSVILAASCRPCLGGTRRRNLSACLEGSIFRIEQVVDQLPPGLGAERTLLHGGHGEPAPMGHLEPLVAFELV